MTASSIIRTDSWREKLTAQPTTHQFKMSPRKMLGSEIAITRLMTAITSVQDPDEMLQKAGIRRYQLRQLELDDEVAQCKDTRVEAVVATPWRIEPNHNRSGKWLTKILTPHVDGMKRDAMESRFYGYSVDEIIFKQVEKGIGINRLSLKPMEWFAPQRDGSLRYFPDDGSGGIEGITVDPMKFLLTRCNASYRNPYGEALLSRLYFPVTWRREGWGLWLQFMETFGEPIVLGQMADYDSFVEAMVTQGVRSTIGFQSVSENDKITTINASTPGEFERLENAILRRIQKLILGQTLTSDVGSNGSYAVAAIHNEVRNDKRRADMRMVQATGQRLVDILCEINRLQYHQFIMSDDAGLELHRAQRDAVLVPVLAASGLTLSKEYLTDRYDFITEDFEEKEVIHALEGGTPSDKTNTKQGGNVDSNRDMNKEATRNRSVSDGENQ